MKKVKIYTFADKAPFFISWQAKAFRDFLKDDYEFIVMNNSSNPNLDKDIKNHCNANALKCIDVENKDFSTAVYSCAVPINECLEKYISKDKNCYSVIIDSDVFLMRDFSFNEYMEDYDVAGIMQSRNTGIKIIEYLWNAFLCINNETFPDLDKFGMGCGQLLHAPGDVGFESYFYLLYHPEVKLKKIPCTGLITNHPEVISLLPEEVRSKYQLHWDMEIFEGSFLHARGMSRWDNKKKEFYEAKENYICEMIKKIKI